jgi:hypothetical protein
MVETNRRIDSRSSKKERKTLLCPKEKRQSNALHITAQKPKALKQDLILSLIKIRDNIAIQQKFQPW